MKKILFLVCLFGQTALSAGPFHFQNYLALREGTDFSIQVKGHSAGKGKVLHNSAHQLKVRYQSTLPGHPVSGEVHLSFHRQVNHRVQLHLIWNGQRDGKKELVDEYVLCDTFLLSSGILSFTYAGQRFFQLSHPSSQDHRFVTEWGAARLIEEK
jgi:hypothetical protein